MIKTAEIKWEYEDELPEIEDDEFDAIFPASRVLGGVRMYPYVEVDAGSENEQKVWLTSRPGNGDCFSGETPWYVVLNNPNATGAEREEALKQEWNEAGYQREIFKKALRDIIKIADSVHDRGADIRS